MVLLHQRGLLASSLLLALLPFGAHAQDSWEPSGVLRPNASLVNSTAAMMSLCPPRNIDVGGGRAIPTNAWWGNLITCDSTTNVTAPLWANPFAITAQNVDSSGLLGYSFGYPYRSRYYGDLSATGVAKFYAHVIHKEVTFSASEFSRITPTMRVVDWSDLGVKLQMRTASTATPVMETSMLSGMAYFTTRYQALTPKLTFEGTIANINSATCSTGSSFTGSKFIVSTSAGLQWVVYATSSLTLTATTSQVLTATASFTGYIRVAAIFSSSQVATYDTYKNCIPLTGNVTFASDSSYSFEWTTTGDCTLGLLHYALPHHNATLDRSSVSMVSGLTLNAATRGLMQAFVTRTSPPVWTMVESGSLPISFYPRTRLNSSDATAQNLFATLLVDIQAQWIISVDGSYYFNGKAANKYANLCLMANDPVIVGTDVSLLKRCLTKLEKALTPFLTNDWVYSLVYDQTFGGIVSSVSFATGDMDADFGNSVYNDHHFHYGYWVYTAAILNYLHPTWSQLPVLNAMTRLLLRDVASPHNSDPYFPKFRSFDWFLGHSYSHGVTSFADGKDEESSSEDVNFQYALYLFGVATNDARMTAIGKVMTKVNARAIQSYFLMESTNTVHPAAFIPHKVTGILFDNKADYATWFSGELFCIHGIQMIPNTPVTEYVRTTNFIREEWTSLLSSVSSVASADPTNAWNSLLYANYARLNRNAALQVLQSVVMDDGLSRSWALYMALQQPTS